MSTEMQVSNQQLQATPMTPKDVLAQVKLVQDVLNSVMTEGEHYGKIPGTNKPTLLKSGAEKLCMTFRMSPSFDIRKTELPNAHREYEVLCRLASIGSGIALGEGVGCCSTMESKYRYRNVADFELTGDPIPKDAKERKTEYRKQGFGMKKVDGVWEWVKYKDTEKSENPDIADVYNTVLKMAKKRALVDAVLTATAASDLFTQDIEDIRGAMADAEREERSDREQERANDKPTREAPAAKAPAKKGMSYYNYDSKNPYVLPSELHEDVVAIMANPWPRAKNHGVTWETQEDKSLISVWSHCHDVIEELKDNPNADLEVLDEAIGVLKGVSSVLVNNGHQPHALFASDDQNNQREDNVPM